MRNVREQKSSAGENKWGNLSFLEVSSIVEGDATFNVAVEVEVEQVI